MAKQLNVGIIGAGYIATWHADAIRSTPNAQLIAVCDLAPGAAQGLAQAHGATAYTDVADMLDRADLDVVHILTPPHLHRDLAVQCLQAGVHSLVEKPIAVSAAEARDMQAAAESTGKHFIAGHNFMGIPGYQRLKAQIAKGALGRINSAEMNWCFPLAPLRSGPFGLWMLRETGNLLLELGPHLFAFVQDLFGTLEVEHLSLGKPVTLSGGGLRPQSWKITGRAGDVDITINLQLVETMDDRSITLKGSSGMARLDYANDALTFAHENASDLVLNPLRGQLAGSWEHLREGVVNAARQLTSLNRKSAYGLSFQGMLAQVYDDIATGQPIDPRFSGPSAVKVMQAIEDSLALIPAEWKDKPAKKPRRTPKPTAMVIGGTGFIGRALTRRLVADGHDVRVLSRGSHGPFSDIAAHVETVPVSLRDADGLAAAMKGIDVVFNLAKSMDKTWDDALKNDVGVSNRIAAAALSAGVKRFVYTGTIASYDMSEQSTTITESFGFAEDMSDRNLYARSKAECERQLLEMHKTQGLPLVIARPGIVVGEGGPLQHWGIGRWHGAGAVRIWGAGHNILPFVLIDDVVDGLVRMIDTDAALGQSFNLVGEQMFSARDYFNAIHDRLGAKITVAPGNLTVFWALDGVKALLKRHGLGRKGVVRASLRDWKSRAHYAKFDNSLPKQVLNWTPETDKSAFLDVAVDQANLMGF